MASLPPPVRVKGTIKFYRYTALILGVMWAQHRHERLAKREAIIREVEAEQNKYRKAKKHIIKQFENREEMLYLGEQAGVTPKDDFDEQYPPPDVQELLKLCKTEVSFVERNICQEGVLPPLKEPCEKMEEIQKQYPPSPYEN